MTPAEKASLPKTHSPWPILPTEPFTPTPCSSTMNPFYIIDECLYDVQKLMEKLKYILVQRTDILDGIAHNQAITDNHFNELCNCFQGQFSTLHWKSDTLIHLGSLTSQCALKGVPLSNAQRTQSKGYIVDQLIATSTKFAKPEP